MQLWLLAFWERLYSALIKSPKLIFKPTIRMVFRLSRIPNFKWSGVLPGRETFSWKIAPNYEFWASEFWWFSAAHHDLENYFTDLKQDSITSHMLQEQTSTLKMGVFWDANQTEWSLWEGMIHVYLECLQDTWGLNVLYFVFGLKKRFQEKNSTTFLRLP